MLDVTDVINLAPHVVAVIAGADTIATWPPSGMVARVVEQVVVQAPVRCRDTEIPVRETAYGPVVEGLPESTPGAIFVVSRVTAAAVSDRDDVYYPWGEVRDPDGQILGCRALGRFQG